MPSLQQFVWVAILLSAQVVSALAYYDTRVLAGSTASGNADNTGTAAKFSYPTGGCRDLNGNFLVADMLNSAIRNVSRGGVVTHVASTMSGSRPFGVDVDSAGNLFIADGGMHVIRMISSSGAASIVAGTQDFPGYLDGLTAQFNVPSDVVVDRTADDVVLFVAGYNNNAVRRVLRVSSLYTVDTVAGTQAAGFVDGSPSTARFNGPSGIALHAATNRLLVADQRNHAVRSILLSTGVVTTIAGKPPPYTAQSGFVDSSAALFALFNLPTDLVVDPSSGVIFVLDSGNNAVRRVTGPNGTVRTIAQNAVTDSTNGNRGSGANFNLHGPESGLTVAYGGIILDGEDGVVVADTMNNQIKYLSEVSFSASLSSVLSKSHSTTSTVAIPQYYAVTTVLGQGPPSATSGYVDGEGTSARLDHPTGLALNTTSSPFRHLTSTTTALQLLVADTYNVAIRQAQGYVPLSNSPWILSGYAGPPAPERQSGYSDGLASASSFWDPCGVAYVAPLDAVSVADTKNNVIRWINRTGGVLTTWTIAGQGTTAGYITNVPASSAQFAAPKALVYSPARNSLLIADTNNCAIRELFLDTHFEVTAAGSPSCGYADGFGTSAKLSLPAGLASALNGSTVFVADTGNHLLRRIDLGASVVVTTLAGSVGVASCFDGLGTAATFHNPTGLAYDPITGSLFVADSGNSVIRVVSTSNGQVRTVAGVCGRPGFRDGVGTYARLGAPTGDPSGLAWDSASSSLVFADTINMNIRLLRPHEPTSLSSVRSKTYTASLMRPSLSATREGQSATGTTLATHSNSTTASVLQSRTMRETPSRSTSVHDELSNSLEMASTETHSLSLRSASKLTPSRTISPSNTPTPSNSSTDTELADVPLLAGSPPSGVSAASSNTAVLSSLLLGGDPASAAQTIYLSLITCSAASRLSRRNQDVSLTTVTISVFYGQGFLAVALGNLALAVVAALLHTAVCHGLAQRRSVTFSTTASGWWMRHPNHSVRIAVFLLPGSVFGAMAILFDSGSSLVASGAAMLALLVSIALVAVRQDYLSRTVLPSAKYRLHSDETRALLSWRWLRPVLGDGWWGPKSFRFRFGSLTNSFTPTTVKWSVMEIVSCCLLACVTAATLFGRMEYCSGSLQAMAALHFSFAAWCATFRPYRLSTDALLVPLVYILFGLQCVLVSLDSTSLVGAAAGLQAAAAVLQVIRLVLSWAVAREEGALAERMGGEESEAVAGMVVKTGGPAAGRDHVAQGPEARLLDFDGGLGDHIILGDGGEADAEATEMLPVATASPTDDVAPASSVAVDDYQGSAAASVPRGGGEGVEPSWEFVAQDVDRPLAVNLQCTDKADEDDGLLLMSGSYVPRPTGGLLGTVEGYFHRPIPEEMDKEGAPEQGPLDHRDLS